VDDKVIIPDSIAAQQKDTHKIKRKILVLEYHKGQRVKRIVEQLKPYAHVIAG